METLVFWRFSAYWRFCNWGAKLQILAIYMIFRGFIYISENRKSGSGKALPEGDEEKALKVAMCCRFTPSPAKGRVGVG